MRGGGGEPDVCKGFGTELSEGSRGRGEERSAVRRGGGSERTVRPTCVQHVALEADERGGSGVDGGRGGGEFSHWEACVYESWRVFMWR